MPNKTYNNVQLTVTFDDSLKDRTHNIASNENIAQSLGKISTWYDYLIPTGATSGQILSWSSGDAPIWIDDGNVKNAAAVNSTFYPAGRSATTTGTGTQLFDKAFKFAGVKGTTSITGQAKLELGNNTASGTAGNKQGSIVVYGTTAYGHTIISANNEPTADRILTLPDKSGIFALTSDIPTVPTVNDATLTFKGAGTSVVTFTANSADNKSLNITAGSNVTITPTAAGNDGAGSIEITSSHPPVTKSADTTSTASPAHGGTFTTVDTVTRDAYGHVTKINTKTITLPADSNTDTKVTQTNTTTSADYRVLLSGNANDTTETTTGRKSNNLRFNPSSGGLYSFGFLWTDITGQTLDINTLTLSDGTLHSRRFIEKTDGGAGNITNTPVAGKPFLLEVDLIRWASTTDYITRQRFTNAANGTYSYVRYCTNGTWGNWTTRKYTDTNTKVTSSANHYTPATVSGEDKSASASGATAAWSIDVVKGVTLNTDGKGHVTGITVTPGKIPTNPVPSGAVFTDANVTQTPADSTYTNYRPLLIGNSSGTSAGFTPTLTTAGVYATAGIYCQPSSGYVYASDFMTNTYPSGTGSSLSQYGLYLKSYFKCADSSQTVLQYAGYGVRTYSGKITSSDGIAMAVGCGGLTVLGSGESAHNLISLISDDQKISGNTTLNVGGTLNTTYVGNSEVAIVSSDENIYFITNCQTIANRKPVCLNTDSHFYPGTNKTGSIGTSSYMWNSVYAATIYENGTSLANKYVPSHGNLNGTIGTNSPAADVKTFFMTSSVPTGCSSIGYNTAGNEYTLIFGKGVNTNGYGAVLKFGYNSLYPLMLRIENGTWKSTDWEKISAGYADISENVSGTVAIAHGGTGATDRLNALRNLTIDNVGTSATYFLTITDSWGKGGYTSVAQAKTVLGLGSAAYKASSDFAVSQTLANDTNLNNITTPGFYNCGGTNSVTNKPSGVDAFGLNVIHDASGQWYTQILYPNNSSPLIYVRNYNSSTWSGWNSIAIGSFLPLSGGTMSGVISSTYKSSTYVASLTSSVITLSDAASSFGGWICGPTKNGRIAISSYQGDNDKLYFGYGERGRTTNSYVKAMTWDGPTNTLTADKFVGALHGNADTATTATKATQDGDGNTISSTYLKLSGGKMTGTIQGTYSNTHIALADGGIGDYGTLDHKNNINISSWYGVSISNGCSNVGTLDQVTFSVNARTGATQQRGNAILYSAGGDSPALIFQRGTFVDHLNDWKIYVTSGALYFAQSTADSSSETWTTKMYFHASDGNLYVGSTKVSLNGHTHNYAGSSSAGGPATNVATEVGTSAGARPVFYAYLGDTTRVVYNTNFTYNPSGNVLTATTFAGALSGNAASATILKTARNINGVSFDGSANITIPRSIKHIHTASGTEGTAGWVKIARITVTAAYANHPMTFTIAQRSVMQYRIHLVLANSGSVAGAAISEFIIARDNSWTNTNNNPRAYIIKPSDGIFDLYIRKTESYDHIFVVDFTKADGSEGDNYSVAWTNVHAADSAITGGTEATKKTYSTTDHTHNYAGSSSAGGAATSADVTVTDVPSTSTTTSDSWYKSYGLLFAQNPNTTQANTLRKSHNLRFYHGPNGTADTVGVGELIVGNNTASGTAGNMQGRLILYSSSSSYISMVPTATSSSITLTLPAVTGTVPSFTATPTSGQVVVTDGTGGGIKSSGSTIVTTPSSKVNSNWGTTSDRTTIVTKGWMSYWDGSYNGSASNLTYCNRGAFGTIVTKNTGDYVPNHGDLRSTIGSDCPAADVKTFFMTSSVPTGTSSIGYNTAGNEYTLIFGKGTNTAGYGAVLKFGYNSLYPEVLRVKGGTWESTNWEKISAGYADRATYLDVVASNEIRFYNDNQFKANNHFWLGYSWAQGSHYTPSGGTDTASTTAPNITKYFMGNCSGGGLAGIHVASLILGQGDTPTSSSAASTLKASAQGTTGTYLLPSIGNGTYTLSCGHEDLSAGSGSLTSTNVLVPSYTKFIKIVFKSDSSNTLYSMVEIPYFGNGDYSALVQVGTYADGYQGSPRIVMKAIIINIANGSETGKKTFTVTGSPTTKINGSNVSDVTRNISIYKIYASD